MSHIGSCCKCLTIIIEIFYLEAAYVGCQASVKSKAQSTFRGRYLQRHMLCQSHAAGLQSTTFRSGQLFRKTCCLSSLSPLLKFTGNFKGPYFWHWCVYVCISEYIHARTMGGQHLPPSVMFCWYIQNSTHQARQNTTESVTELCKQYMNSAKLKN